MDKNVVVLLLVVVVGVFALFFVFSSITGSYAYGSSKGHTYFYETGTSGITGPPDFIVTKGLGSVPYCFNIDVAKGGFQTNTTPNFTWDYVSCYVVAPDDLFGKDRGSLPVHCFLRSPYRFPQGLPHPAVCELLGKEIRYQDGGYGGRATRAAAREAPPVDVAARVTVPAGVDVVAPPADVAVSVQVYDEI